MIGNKMKLHTTNEMIAATATGNFKADANVDIHQARLPWEYPLATVSMHAICTG